VLCIGHAGQCWAMLWHAGPRWAMLGHVGPCWAMLGHAGPRCEAPLLGLGWAVYPYCLGHPLPPLKLYRPAAQLMAWLSLCCLRRAVHGAPQHDPHLCEWAVFRVIWGFSFGGCSFSTRVFLLVGMGPAFKNPHLCEWLWELIVHWTCCSTHCSHREHTTLTQIPRLYYEYISIRA
jgi:hypothetical protein